MKQMLMGGLAIGACVLLGGCHSASVIMYGGFYPATMNVEVVGDTSAIVFKYKIIGQVHAHGGITVDYETLLQDMKEQARWAGADVLFAPQFGSHGQVVTNYWTGTTSVQKPDASALMIRYERDQDGNPVKRK